MSINYTGSGGGIPRKTAKIFAENSDANDMTVFGSTLANNTTYSKDLDSIQSSAYETGWRDAVISNLNYPLLSDMNGVQHVLSQQIAYILQHGCPEWNAGTTYYAYDLVASGGIIYTSLIDENTNNAVTDDTKWAVYYNPSSWRNCANTDLSNLTATGETHFANKDLNNLTNDGKWTVSSLSAPSSTYKDIGIGASGSSYTAPSNGWVVIQGTITNSTSYIWGHAQVDFQIWGGNAVNNGLHLSFPVAKGANFEVYYYNMSMTLMRFYYDIGSQHEVNL